ncbi:CopD family protein, partial [Planktotalea sp.]|uniref:copper resistance D family protein n=1 Tax=Planktotalea sp. TaxID=2029877 RepID=UPI003298AE26
LALLWSTPVGTAFALRVMGLGLLIVGLFIGRLGVALTLIGSALTLWSFTLTGHIPTLDNPMLNALLLFHLVAISFWIGVLTPLRALASDASKIATATALGARFGKRAAAFVPLLIIAGVFMTYTLVGSVSALFRSSYGQALLLKVLLVAGLLGLAAANKLRFIPQMAKGDTAAAKHLAKSISLEWIVIAAVLLTTAVLTSVLTLPN